MWFQNETCIQTCRDASNKRAEISTPIGLKNKLADIIDELSLWESANFENITSQMAECRKVMDLALHESVDSRQLEIIREAEEKMQDLLLKEEIMWKQRSRIQWLAWGDKNTSYFHRAATGRRERNFISQIMKENGEIAYREEEVEATFRSYFVDLFKAGEDIDMTEALDAVDLTVDTDMNSQLCKPFTKEEIVASLDKMHPRWY